MADLTKAAILTMENAEFIKLISTPEGKAQVEAVWNAEPEASGGAQLVELTPEEQAAADQAAADAELVAKAEADRVAAEAEAAEQTRKEAEEAAKKAVVKPQKIVVEYQAKDLDGNPIGRPTHLEADTWEEMSKKQQDAHVNAVRAYERLKGQKVTFKKEVAPAPRLTDEELETALEEVRKEKDPQKAAAAIRKITGADEVELERQKLVIEREENRQRAVSLEFMTAHRNDFNPCNANSQVIADFILANELEWTRENLEVAFANTESQLAPVIVPAVPVIAPTPPANPEVVAPVATVQAPVVETPVAPVVPAPTAVAPAPVVAPVQAAADNPPAARRVPSSGVVPGSTAGRTGVPAPAGLTKQDIAKMTREQFKIAIRDPKKRLEIEKVLNSK